MSYDTPTHVFEDEMFQAFLFHEYRVKFETEFRKSLMAFIATNAELHAMGSRVLDKLETLSKANMVKYVEKFLINRERRKTIRSRNR
jgi:formate dehydrogenase maturation protein FdhE